MIAILGSYNEEKHATAVRDLVTWERWQRDALTTSYREMMDHWRLYLSQRRDHRKSWEKTWRALTLQPYPYLIVEGHTNAVTDILNSADPLIQAEGVGDEDVEIARKMERLLDLTLRMNQWRLFTELLARESAIQGTAAFKVSWRHDQSRILDQAPDGVAQFEGVTASLKEMGLEVPQDAGGYEQFTAGPAQELGLKMPTHPDRMYKDVTTFQGPAFDRVSIFDLRFDPLTEKWPNQRRVIQRIVKTKKWVLDHTGEDPGLPFDPESVKHSIDVGSPEGTNTGGMNTWQQEVAQMLGLESAATGYPLGANDLAEIMECFDPTDDEAPYKVMLNRHCIINKDPGGMPYGHGENPIHLVRGVPVPGSALGLSLLKAPKRLFYELWTLRDLRVDHVTMATIPAFQKLNEIGIPDAAKVLQPGGTIALPRLDSLKKLDLGGPHPDIWREIDSIKQEIDDATSVPTNMRGQPATVGRVSAAESQQRFSSAMVRIKAAAVRFEEELTPAIRQAIYLWYQNGDPELLLRAAGQGAERYAQTITKEELNQAIDMDFNFRGPSRVLNRDMLVQQMMQWYGSFQLFLKPSKQMAFARQVYEIMGLRNRNEVLPDEDIALAMQQEQMAAMMPQLPPGQPAPPGMAQPPEQPQAPPGGPPVQTQQPAERPAEA